MNLDWDSILSYNTIKIVRIRDRRLGLLHLSFMVCIIVYIVIYQAIYKKGYLVLEEPVGSIRTSLLAPKEFNTTFSYCNDTQLYYPFQKLACEFWDDPLVSYPIGDDVGFTASTRVKIVNQTTGGCSFKNPKCKFYEVSEENVYIADIERFTVLIDHTMYAPSSLIQYNAHDLHGYIQTENGDEVQLNEGINTVGIEGKDDIIEIGKLLEFAGINLDDPSPLNSSNSIRYDGVVALVFITYSNTFSYNTNRIKYVYSIKKVEDTIYDVSDPMYFDSLSNRLVLKRHGVRLIFIQTGEIGSFQFQALLLTLVSGLGLLTVATLVVDQLAVRFLPQRKSYQSVKFQVTESMSRKKKIINDDGEELLYSKIEGL